jgi:hypothetical protein
VYRVQIDPGSRLRGMAIRRGLSYDPAPPYMVRSTPSFSARDLQAAEYVSCLVRMTATNAVVRGAVERAVRRSGGRKSYVGVCREAAAALRARGVRILARRYLEWTRSVPAGAHPADISWPDEAAAGELSAVLRAVGECASRAGRRHKTSVHNRPVFQVSL